MARGCRQCQKNKPATSAAVPDEAEVVVKIPSRSGAARRSRSAAGPAGPTRFIAFTNTCTRLHHPRAGKRRNAPINVKVEGGSRGQEADRELAAQIGGEVHAAVRSIIAEELILQKRQGGLLSG